MMRAAEGALKLPRARHAGASRGWPVAPGTTAVMAGRAARLAKAADLEAMVPATTPPAGCRKTRAAHRPSGWRPGRGRILRVRCVGGRRRDRRRVVRHRLVGSAAARGAGGDPGRQRCKTSGAGAGCAVGTRRRYRRGARAAVRAEPHGVSWRSSPGCSSGRAEHAGVALLEDGVVPVPAAIRAAAPAHRRGGIRAASPRRQRESQGHHAACSSWAAAAACPVRCGFGRVRRVPCWRGPGNVGAPGEPGRGHRHAARTHLSTGAAVRAAWKNLRAASRWWPSGQASTRRLGTEAVDAGPETQDIPAVMDADALNLLALSPVKLPSTGC